MRREEKPTTCHFMLYCIYDTLNIFRALICPSSGALDYIYKLLPPMVCSAWPLVVGGQVQDRAPDDGHRISRNMLSVL